MQTPPEKTAPMLLSTEEELFTRFVKTGHPFRKLATVIDFPRIIDPLRALYSEPYRQRKTCGYLQCRQ